MQTLEGSADAGGSGSALGAPEVRVAVVGVGCRLPGGVRTPDDLWKNIDAGVVSVVPFGGERWRVSEFAGAERFGGKAPCMVAGLLDDVTSFDAALFSVSPREARTLDPQQRLLLEVTWSALEDAGIAPSSLAGSDTGVFIGAGAVDHTARVLNPERPDEIDSYSATSALASVMAGRVAYFLGTHGPCMVVDTACSSSLVAVHLACKSLRDGSSDIALAGGVNVISSPALSVALSHMNAISPSGRCAAFDASADGFCRGEGAGVVVLKRLEDALASGDRIYGLVLSSGINHDGRSNGLTAPNPIAQEQLLRRTLARARLAPADVSYLEAHGTGTLLGDPIEVGAASAVYGRERTRPLWIGSLKSNIGHLEAAAGIAGFIKALLVLGRRTIPAQAQLKTPNPHIDWQASGVRLPLERVSLGPASAPLRAAVSSFGFSGTNAHVILEEARLPPPQPQEPDYDLFALSGVSEAALMARIRDMSEHVRANASQAPRSIARTLGVGRDHHEHRLAIVADSMSALTSGLASAGLGQDGAGICRGRAGRERKVCFVFVGQGSQRPGMGRELAARHPVFKAALERCAAAYRGLTGEDLLAVIWSEQAGDHPVHDTLHAQPALFAFEFAMASLLEAYGVRPRAALGHSIGEVVAASVAGVLDVEDGMRIAVSRGQLMQRIAESGSMFAINAAPDRAEPWLSAGKGRVQLAAINGPESIVVSGATPLAELVAAQARHEGFRVTQLRVSHAFHSPLMAAAGPELLERLRGVKGRPGRFDMVSTVTGDWLEPERLDAEHFRTQLVAPVLFHPALLRLAERGEYQIVEIGPQPHLTALLKSQPAFASALPSCRGAGSEHRSLLQAMAQLYVTGSDVRWSAMYADPRVPKVGLPQHPFQRDQFPFSAVPQAAPRRASGSPRRAGHPLLGEPAAESTPLRRVFETTVGATRYPFLEDHRIEGAIVLPGVVYLSLAEALVTECTGAPPAELSDVRYHKVLVVPPGGERRLRLILDIGDGRQLGFRVESRDEFDSGAWLLHAEGTAQRADGMAVGPGRMTA